MDYTARVWGLYVESWKELVQNDKMMSKLPYLDEVHQHHDGGRGLLRRLDHDAVAGCERGGDLPRSHQEREVPRNDLADHAQRLLDAERERAGLDTGRYTAHGTRGGTRVVRMSRMAGATAE